MMCRVYCRAVWCSARRLPLQARPIIGWWNNKSTPNFIFFRFFSTFGKSASSLLSVGFGALVGGRDLRAFIEAFWTFWANVWTGGSPDVFAFRTFRTSDQNFLKKMRFSYWRQKNTALYIQRGRIIRKNITIMYVIYVQTTLIQTDTNDTMYQRKTVKFVFWKNSFFLRYHIYHPNSGNVGVSTISRFCEIPPFRNEIQHFANEIPHFRERDTTQPVIFAQNRPFFTPFSPDTIPDTFWYKI